LAEPDPPRLLTDLPRNFDRLLEGIARGFEALYGPAAGAVYRENGVRVFKDMMQSDRTRLWACGPDNEATLVLLEMLRDRRGEVMFAHALPECGAAEQVATIRRVTEGLRERGAHSILAEFVPTDDTPWHERFAEAGYRVFHREVMQRGIDDAYVHDAIQSGLVSTAAEPGQWAELGACLIDAYRDHPGRDIHEEVAEQDKAVGLIERVLGGQAGASHEDLVRGLWHEGTCVAVAVGAIVAPGVGFVIQVAVRQRHQGKGLGTRLLREMAAVFREYGANRVMLGVTVDNPAKRLYHAEGFTRVRPFTTHVWRPEQ